KHQSAALRTAPGGAVEGICCRSEANAVSARSDFPSVPVHRDYIQLLKDPAIQAVDIVVPTYLHAEIGVAPLESGKDVLLEKPMALTVAECDWLIATAATHQGVLSIGHEFRVATQRRTARGLGARGARG